MFNSSDEFKEYLTSDIHTLSDLISKSEIPFENIEKYLMSLIIPPLITSSILMHDDCTIEAFGEYYPQIKERSGLSILRTVIENAKIMANNEAVAIAVSTKNEKFNAEFDNHDSFINSYYASSSIWKSILKNPYIDHEIKTRLYKITGNEKFLNNDLKDLFIF